MKKQVVNFGSLALQLWLLCLRLPCLPMGGFPEHWVPGTGCGWCGRLEPLPQRRIRISGDGVLQCTFHSKAAFSFVFFPSLSLVCCYLFVRGQTHSLFACSDGKLLFLGERFFGLVRASTSVLACLWQLEGKRREKVSSAPWYLGFD